MQMDEIPRYKKQILQKLGLEGSFKVEFTCIFSRLKTDCHWNMEHPLIRLGNKEKLIYHQQLSNPKVFP